MFLTFGARFFEFGDPVAHPIHYFQTHLPSFFTSNAKSKIVSQCAFFLRKISIFQRRSGQTWACFGHVFQPYRSAVQSFPFLSAPCPPSWTSKILANMCIIATGGFLGRLEPCIRHDFDDIFMYATLCWWHFDISDMILNAFFTFWHHVFIIFLKMCSPPAQEAQFEMAA